jgi:hypothetical protein
MFSFVSLSENITNEYNSRHCQKIHCDDRLRTKFVEPQYPLEPYRETQPNKLIRFLNNEYKYHDISLFYINFHHNQV